MTRHARFEAGVVIIAVFALAALAVLILRSPAAPQSTATADQIHTLLQNSDVAIIPPSAKLQPGEHGTFIVGIGNKGTQPVVREIRASIPDQANWFSSPAALLVLPGGQNSTAISYTVPATASGSYAVQVDVCADACSSGVIVGSRKFVVTV